ncbi:hypothetical protein QJS66_07985 [Kocuria rhizophila]|nr:hypothetical protein QJS66_07985 [Kocuria rhizophila]
MISTAYWHPGSGAHMLRNKSSIGAKFLGAGQRVRLRLPLSTEERPLPGGAYQVFRAPNGLHHQGHVDPPKRPARHQEQGAIGKRWAQGGMDAGTGFPTTDEYRRGTILARPSPRADDRRQHQDRSRAVSTL